MGGEKLLLSKEIMQHFLRERGKKGRKNRIMLFLNSPEDKLCMVLFKICYLDFSLLNSITPRHFSVLYICILGGNVLPLLVLRVKILKL